MSPAFAARLATIFLGANPKTNCADAARLSPDDRLREVAVILAVGVIRLRRRVALRPDETLENLAESSAAGLEVLNETVLSVHNG